MNATLFERRIDLKDMPVNSFAIVAVHRDEIIFRHETGWVSLLDGSDHAEYQHLTVIPLKPGAQLVVTKDK